MTGHVERQLIHGERILHRARYHWLVNMQSAFTLNIFSQIAVTNRRVIEKSGILTTRTRSIAFDQIESMDLTQSLMGRVLGFGSVTLMGAGAANLELRSVAEPHRIVQVIGAASGQNAVRAPAGGPGGRQPGKPKRAGLE